MEVVDNFFDKVKDYGKTRTLSFTLAVLMSLGVCSLSGCSREEINETSSITDVIDDTTFIDKNLNCNGFIEEEHIFIDNINKYEKGFGNRKKEINLGIGILATDIIKGMIASALMIPEINFNQIAIINDGENYYSNITLNDGTIISYNLLLNDLSSVLLMIDKANLEEFEKDSGKDAYFELRNILNNTELLVLDNTIHFINNEVKRLNASEKKKYMEENISENISNIGYAKGIDVSYCQSGVDYETLFKVNKDISFMYSRSFYFFDGGNVDPNFITSCKSAYDNGVACGTYYWPTCESPSAALNEVGYFVDSICRIEKENNFTLDLPVVLDIESIDSGGNGLLEKLDAGDYNAWNSLGVTVNALKMRGINVVLYFSDWFTVSKKLEYFKNKFDVDIWCAKYPSCDNIMLDSNLPNCNLECSNYVMWQYTEHGQIKSNPNATFLFDIMNTNLLNKEYNKEKIERYVDMDPITTYIPASDGDVLENNNSR